MAKVCNIIKATNLIDDLLKAGIITHENTSTTTINTKNKRMRLTTNKYSMFADNKKVDLFYEHIDDDTKADNEDTLVYMTSVKEWPLPAVIISQCIPAKTLCYIAQYETYPTIHSIKNGVII